MLIAHHDSGGGQCTATLIAPNLLLTARHCVSPGTEDETVQCGNAVLGAPYPPDAFFATNATQPRDGSTFFRARSVAVPVEGEDTCGYDLALITLEENVPEAISTPAVPRIDREVAPGEEYTAVGYGLNEDGNSTGTRMQLSGLSIACEPGSCGSGVESTEFRGETGICSGDSGGPAIDTDGKVVGVVSRGGPGCSTPVYGTVTAWRDFLIETATKAAELGKYEPPFWVTTGSSDEPDMPGGDGTGSAGAASSNDASVGEPCGVERRCADQLVCYTATASAEDARCVATCDSASECSDGEECRQVSKVSLCLSRDGKGVDDSGCTVDAQPTSPRVPWLAILGIGALALRRRRFG